jgi:hypothetical protein
MVKMGNVWDRTAEFLSDNIAAILPIALIAFFIPASIAGNFDAASLGASPGVRLSLGMVQVAFAVLSVWGSLAITAMALDIAGTEGPARIALRRLPATLLVSIVLLLGLLLLATPIGVILALSGTDFAAMPDPSAVKLDPSSAGAIGIYGVVLFFVLLWLFARLIVVTPVIVREGRMFGAIPQSWRLTRGSALRIVGVLILYVVVAWVAQLAAVTVFGTIFALIAGGDGEGISLAGVLTSIVAGAVQTGFSVLMPAFIAKLYLALIAEVGLHSSAERL